MKEFCWNELLTKDVEKSKNFYTALFGWTAVEMKKCGCEEDCDCNYTVFKNKDKDVAGLMKKPCCDTCDHEAVWLSYIYVEDVDASAQQAEKLGGKIEMGPMDIPTIGRFAVITDCCGAKVGLFTKK